MEELRINIGSTRERNVAGFKCVDIMDNADYVCDLNGKWCFDDNSVDYIRAHDCLEHLTDKIHTFNEAYRVLKAGGTFEIMVPSTDGRGAFQDPTHRLFYNRNSFWYFTQNLNPACHKLALSHYGVKCHFYCENIQDYVWIDDNISTFAILKAIK